MSSNRETFSVSRTRRAMSLGQMFLDIVESVCNEAAEQDDEDENFLIPRCDELGHSAVGGCGWTVEPSGDVRSPIPK
jgi:hypothetical protein